MAKHIVTTRKETYTLEDNPGNVINDLTEGDGYALITDACSLGEDCREALEKCFANSGAGEEGGDRMLGDDSCTATILKSTTLNPTTKGAILHRGNVLLVPQQARVHFRHPNPRTNLVVRVTEAPQYTTGDQSLVIMKMQFLGGPGERYRVFLVNGSHKADFGGGGEMDRIDIGGGDECVSRPSTNLAVPNKRERLLYNGALLISYPLCVGPDGGMTFTLHTMYLVKAEGLKETPGLPVIYIDKLVKFGGSEVKVVLINSRLNIEWF
ncbi:MAG: hypothetical protein M1840_000831 [Geoglossum simile]|nr:MAG: hypothetical protein M1840_000831 [Geoglossum simile]